MLALPAGQDSKFDITLRRSRRKRRTPTRKSRARSFRSNSTSTTIFSTRHLSRNNQDIWGPGEAFSFHEQEFIGLDETFDPPQIDIPIPPTPLLLFGDACIDAKVGFDFEVSITGGELDATIPFDVNLDTAYNKTTDQLLVDPCFVISASGATITAEGPGGFLSIQPIFDVLFDLQVGLDLIVDELELRRHRSAGQSLAARPHPQHGRCQCHDPACPGLLARPRLSRDRPDRRAFDREPARRP